ncbi:tRNA-dihydrouridine synthase [Clostridia bacterium]|nr:tRNA-dihydrouridine synthase [Clostridia bacterium]
MSFTIGKIKIDNSFILAPMAGVSDRPFRLLCKEQGCALMYTEMVSAKALCYGNQQTQKLLATDPQEEPIALQLFGSEPEFLAEAVDKLNDSPFAFIDLNMGCPVEKVVKNGEGSALLKNPPLVEKILKSMVKVSVKPILVKMRIGFKRNEILVIELAKIAEQCGVSAVAIHGRTREEFYQGQANWEVIRQVKEAVSIPVLGSGDVDSAIKAKQMLEETGCDGVMIARAARGNPWIFRQCIHYFRTGEYLPSVDVEEKRKMIFRHLALESEEKGEYLAVREMRKHFAWYSAGMKNSAQLRQEINQAESLQDFQESMKKLS